ncbi:MULTISPECIES: DUF7124 domain-containing protein [Saliphagus]|uniref:DUF7124 domain-containing protein n=1 Tax=Saliphagus infecundisoli TaxID=1849069 RepID=A0ABD5QMB7_9EURY|nr:MULTISPECIES: hypothetical protein [Saliphagus]
MSIDGSADPGPGDVTLAVTPSAVSRLEDPRAAFEDAATWTHYVGVLGNHTEEVAAVVETHDLRQDFDLGDRDIWLAAQDVRAAADTPRYVLVGTSDEHQRVAGHTGWEFVRVTEAAEKADWELSDGGNEGDEEGLVARLVAALPF